MFTLDGIFDIAYLAVSCALSAAFLAWAVVSACLVRRPRKGAGTAVLVVMAVLWSAVLLLTLAAVLTHFGVFSAGADGTLTLFGVQVPYLGDVAARTDCPVSWALAGAVLAFGIAGFVLNGVRGGKRVPSAAAGRLPEAQAGEPAGLPAEETADTAERAADVCGAADGADGDTAEAVSAGETDEPAAAGARPAAYDTPAAAEIVRDEAAESAKSIAAGAGGEIPAGTADAAGETAAAVPEKPAADGGTEAPIAVSARPVPPVTRKYVLLNRGNVAHMFNEYLSSLDEESKARLEQSLNTIIVKD